MTNLPVTLLEKAVLARGKGKEFCGFTQVLECGLGVSGWKFAITSDAHVTATIATRMRQWRISIYGVGVAILAFHIHDGVL